MGGENIFRVRGDDPNRNVIVETMTQGGARSVMAQRYIPEIKDGDKRVLLIDGKPVPHCLARIPKAGESRGNLAAGGARRRAAAVGAATARSPQSWRPDARSARPAAGRPGRDRRLPHRGERHQPDLLPRDPGPDRLRRRRHVPRRAGRKRASHDRRAHRHARRDRRGAARQRRARSSAAAAAACATLGVSRNDDPDDDLAARGASCSSGSSTRATACWCSPTSSAPRPATSPRACSTTASVEGVSGVSLPMLMRVLTGRDTGSLPAAVKRALSGGAEGVVHMTGDAADRTR